MTAGLLYYGMTPWVTTVNASIPTAHYNESAFTGRFCSVYSSGHHNLYEYALNLTIEMERNHQQTRNAEKQLMNSMCTQRKSS